MWKSLLQMVVSATAVAIVLTWPIAMNLTTSVPAETESRGTVPLFNLWTYNWNASALTQGYSGYWDAGIFHPEPNSFALSEPQPVTGVIYFVLLKLVGDEVAAYNALVLLALVANGVAVFLFARMFGIHPTASHMAGILGTALPFAFQELGAIQLVMLWPVVLSLMALLSFARAPSVRSALSLGGALALVFLTCSYYALLISVFLLLAPPFLVTQRHLTVRAMGALAIGAAFALLLVSPVLIKQSQVLDEYSRDSEIVEATSAKPIDYFHLDRNDWRRSVGIALGFRGGALHYLYPGSAILLAALAGCFSVRGAPHARWVLYCGLASVLAVVVSVSPRIAIGDTSLFHLVTNGYPGFEQLRNVYRFAAFAQVFLLAIAMFGLHRLWTSPQPAARWIAVGLVGIGVIEVARLPLRLYEVPKSEIEAPWVDAVARRPERPLVVFPVYQGERSRGREGTVVAMLQSLHHGMPLLQGYSGFFPASHETFREAMASFPDEESIAFLIRNEVGYIVVRTDWLTDERRRTIERFVPNVEWIYSDAHRSVAAI